MKNISFLAGFLLLGWSHLSAAVTNHPVLMRVPEYDNGVRHINESIAQKQFTLQLISEDDAPYRERMKDGQSFVGAKKGARYSIRLYNPLPVQVGVNLSVDGVNTISGKPSGIADGSKWIIEPYSSVVIRGWQVNSGESRRFFFTDKPASYAAWRGHTLKADLAANCGVIGAAWFWSQAELDRYNERHPIYKNSVSGLFGSSDELEQSAASGKSLDAGTTMRRQSPAPAAPKEEQRAGTGMGERESHPTQLVDFQFDRGMYSPSQAVLLFYDFEKPVRPNPFPGLSFAPEMPSRY